MGSEKFIQNNCCVKEPVNSLLNIPFFKKQFVAICKTIEKLRKHIIKIILVYKNNCPQFTVIVKKERKLALFPNLALVM